MKQPCNLVAVTVTPFKQACHPDFELIAGQTEKLSRKDIDAIFPCASTGEFVRISAEEKIEILRTVSQCNIGQKRLIAGACDASEDGVIQFLKAAKRYAYKACVVCPPYYYGLSQDDVLRFYQLVCEAAEGMPIIAYHVPFFTTGIELDTLCRLLEIHNLVGIKDSSANMKRIAHTCNIVRQERPAFAVYTGTDDCLLPALCAGCTGSMTALGASMPDIIRAIYQAFYRKDLDCAMSLQQLILPILREADRFPFPMGYKLLSEAVGWEVGNIEWEKYSGAQDTLERMKKLLQIMKDETFYKG